MNINDLESYAASNGMTPEQVSKCIESVREAVLQIPQSEIERLLIDFQDFRIGPSSLSPLEANIGTVGIILQGMEARDIPPQLPMDLSGLEVSLSKTDISSGDLAHLFESIKSILQLEGFSLPEFIKISITQFIHQHPSKESIHIPIELRKKAINVLERNGFSGDDLSKLIYIIERSESPLGEAINKDEYDEWFAEFKSLSPEQQQTVIVEAEGALRKDAALAGFTDEQIAEVVALFLSLPSGGARDIFFRLKMLIIRSLEPHA